MSSLSLYFNKKHWIKHVLLVTLYIHHFIHVSKFCNKRSEKINICSIQNKVSSLLSFEICKFSYKQFFFSMIKKTSEQLINITNIICENFKLKN